MTMVVVEMFGRTCRQMMPSEELPIARLAATYSRSFTTSVSALTRRAYCAQPDSPNSPMSTGMLAPIRATSAMITRSNGNANWMSTSRMMIESVSPPK